jgi:hypothetical protein
VGEDRGSKETDGCPLTAIELEYELSPRFHKVYPMTLTEQMEIDTFLEEALATGHIR